MDESTLKILLDGLERSRSALDSWLFWATLLVVVGVVLEVAIVFWEHWKDRREYRQQFVDFQQGIQHPPERPSIRLATFSLSGALLVALGVSGELHIGAKIGSVETEIRKANGDRATLLSKEAGDAKRSARDAEDAAGRAKGEADEASTSARNALSLAEDARSEADSFEQDIVSAKKLAAEAESHLADALKQAADATAELHRVKSPRSLTHIPELISKLEPFKGTEYTFSMVFGDEESIMLLRGMDDLLHRAGWIRVKPAHTFPMINVYGSSQDFAVASGFNTGFQVFVDSSEPITSLELLPIDKLPRCIQAAVALNLSIPPNLFPPQEGNKMVNVETGTSAVVRIAVGRKP